LHGPHNSNVPEFPHNDPLGGIEETPLGKGCEEASKKNDEVRSCRESHGFAGATYMQGLPGAGQVSVSSTPVD
jgi:hypothetical protein